MTSFDLIQGLLVDFWVHDLQKNPKKQHKPMRMIKPYRPVMFHYTVIIWKFSMWFLLNAHVYLWTNWKKLIILKASNNNCSTFTCRNYCLVQKSHNRNKSSVCVSVYWFYLVAHPHPSSKNSCISSLQHLFKLFISCCFSRCESKNDQN